MNKEFPASDAERRFAGADAGSGGGRYEEVLMREAYGHIGKAEYKIAAHILDDLLRRFAAVLDDDQKSVINSELGTLYFWLGDYESAIKHCENALGYGDNDQAYSILGKTAVAQFKFPQARGYFSKISEENPARCLGLCLVCIKLRDTIGVKAYLEEVYPKVSKSDPEYLLYVAYLNLLKGHAKDAVAQTREAVKKCEHDPSLILIVAEIFMTAGNYGEAVGAAKKVASYAPENDQVYGILAHAAYAEEDFKNAETHADCAVRRNPLNEYAKTVLMKLAVRRGSYALAEKIGTDILRNCPEYSLGHANLGDVYFNQGRYELAQIEYEQTMQLMDSDTKGARLRKARMKFMEGDLFGAQSILENLVEMRHTYYDDAMCDLLLCYDKMGAAPAKAALIDKMIMRRSFYHRAEKLLKSFGA